MKFLLILFCVAYGIIYALLIRPISPSSSAKISGQSEQNLTSKQKVIQEMAQYVEHAHESQKVVAQSPASARPKANFFPNAKPIQIGTFEINDQLKEQMSTPEGVEALQKQIGDRAGPMSGEVETAFKKDQFQNAEEQNTLLDLAHVLAHVTQNSVMTDRLSTEAERYLVPSESQDSVYGGRALQYYLDTEIDPDKKAKFVRALHPEATPKGQIK